MKREIICGDALDVLPKLAKYELAIADIPDNLGREYKGFCDSRSEAEYLLWIRLLILEVLPKVDTFWLIYHANWDLQVKSIAAGILKYRNPSFQARSLIWNFNFGMYREADHPNDWRGMLRLKRSNASYYCESVRVESERVRLGDSRAQPDRVTGDLWMIPRVAGNHPERVLWADNHLPEILVSRIIRLSTKSGDNVLDICSGSGTVFRACRDRAITAIEVSRYYVGKILESDSTIVEIGQE